MYRIKYYDDYVYIPGDSELYVLTPTLEMEKGKAGTLTFTITDTHPLYSELEKLKLGITVEDETGKTIYKGRIVETEQNFDNEYTVTVGGKLSVLNDSPCRPFEFSGSPEELFTWFIDNHNEQVSDEQKILKGNVTVTDPNDYIARDWEQQDNTWSLMNSRLIDTLGGTFVLRHEADGDYLDWVGEFNIYSTQDIVFGENLLDLNLFIDANETYTMCIPYGAEIIETTYAVIDEEDPWQEDMYYILQSGTYVLISSEDDFNTYLANGTTIYRVETSENTGQRLSIADVNGGLDYIINEELKDVYGIICAPPELVTWEDVTIPNNLLTKAVSWLNNEGVMLNASVELTALDLSKLGVNAGSIEMYQLLWVRSTPHNLEASYLVDKMTIKLDAPEDLVITLGKSEKTLVDELLGNKKDTDKVVGEFENIIKDNIEIREEISEQASYVLKTAEEITLGILAGYTTINDLETYKKEIANLFSATEEGFSFEFSQLESTLTELGKEINEQHQYIRLVEGEIHIGHSDSPITSVYTNDALEFRYNGMMVARFTNEVLEVRNIAVDNQIAFFEQWAIRQGAYIDGVGYNLNDMWIGG